MPVMVDIRRNTYQDSVTLMRLSSELLGEPGIGNAALLMGTPQNIELLREGGLGAPELADVRPADLIVAVAAASEAEARAAIAAAAVALDRASAPSPGPAAQQRPALRTITDAASETNLALISAPGPYAGAEALKALKAGLHVHLFSDNVPVDQEVTLKRFVLERDLLMMGPDAGTSIVNGTPVGFANAVRRGRVGVIAASGTGAQQVTVLVHRLGSGVSQAFGTGGRDLSSPVGGLMTRQALRALLDDDRTTVVVLVSKPPAPEVAAMVLDEAAGTRKPVVVCFLGADPGPIRARGLVAAETLEEAAIAAVRADRGEVQELAADGDRTLPPLGDGQRYVRGLFSGGTFCYEALLILQDLVGEVHSNIPLDKRLKLTDVDRSVGHTCIDFGEDEFTVGRPHPMIDFRLRNRRIVQEAGDPETAVILLDLVLGYGANPDPAAALLPAVQEAQEVARRQGRPLPIVASVCGTEEDPQDLRRQEEQLRSAGVTVLPSNARAARLAGEIVAVGRPVGSRA